MSSSYTSKHLHSGSNTNGPSYGEAYDISNYGFCLQVFENVTHSSKRDSTNKEPPTSVSWRQVRRWDAVTIQPSCYWRLRGEWNHIKYVSGGRSSLYASSLITLTTNIILLRCQNQPTERSDFFCVLSI